LLRGPPMPLATRPAVLEILEADGGVFGTFWDVTAPWTAVYLTGDVYIQ